MNLIYDLIKRLIAYIRADDIRESRELEIKGIINLMDKVNNNG